MMTPFSIPKGFRVTALVAHPDDEAVGCGGLLARLAREGAVCRAVLVFHRTDSRVGDLWPVLVDAFKASCAELGSEAVVAASLPESGPGLDTQRLHDALIDEVVGSDLVLTHWGGDTHQAHRALERAVEIATRPFRRHCHLWQFETPTSSDQGLHQSFSPNLCVALSREDVEAQRRAFARYPDSEHAPGRTTGDILDHARYRGRQYGLEFASPVVATRMYV